MASKGRDWAPTKPPKNATLDDVLLWIEQEFNSLVESEPRTLQLTVSHAVPPKPRAGMLAYADGTDWNPGSGQGVYRFSIGAAWVFLG